MVSLIETSSVSSPSSVLILIFSFLLGSLTVTIRAATISPGRPTYKNRACQAKISPKKGSTNGGELAT